MLLKGNTVLENIDEGNLTRELEIAKFRNYGREKFSELINYNINFEEYFRISSRFYSIQLPKEISDILIRADIAPLFIMTNAPILRKIEEMLVAKKSDYNFITNYREIKNHYKNWLNKKNHKEKNHFAASIINSVERNFEMQSFYSVMLYGIVLTFDKISYNPKKAVELFNRAEEIVEDCKIIHDGKSDLLYLINIYKGFVYLQEFEYLKSLETFKKSLDYNQYGVTAIFYCALSARYIDDFDLSFDYLKEIIEFDKLRFNYAINYNQLFLFNFFYENAIFYNVFAENGFAQLLPDIDFLLKSLYSDDENSMEKTYSKLINLDNLRIKEFFDDKVFVEIKFLKQALDLYKQKKTGLIRIVEQIFRDKLIVLIEHIRNLIETHYFERIKEEIVVFDTQIEQNKRQLTRIKQEFEDSKKRVKSNLEEATKYLEEDITEKKEYLEEKLKSLDNHPKYNPSQVLYSSMVFTVLIALIIILVVGVITSFFGFGNEVVSSKLAIKTGLKWGGITFVFGIFISIFTALSSFWEKGAHKKELLNKLKKLKEEEEEEIGFIDEDSKVKVNIYEQKFRDRIKNQEKIINEFIVERENNYNKKYNLARREIEGYTTPLNNLLKILNGDG